MILRALLVSRPRRVVVSLVAVAFLVCVVSPPTAPARAQDETLNQIWEEVSSLRMQGEYDQAIEILTEVLNTYPEREEILRHAYNHLVFTYNQKGDVPGTIATARQALLRFPDLYADHTNFHPSLNMTYDALRGEMFGSVSVTKPDEGQVFLDEEPVGMTPFHRELVMVGEHKIVVVKDGYHDKEQIIHVAPSGVHSYEITMDRKRGGTWWLARLGPAFLTGLVVAIAGRGSGGEGEPAAEPLPEPPPPPSR